VAFQKENFGSPFFQQSLHQILRKMDDIFESLKTHNFNLEDHNPSLRRYGIGFPHTEETKQHISEMKTGLKQTTAHIQKRVEKMKGFKQSKHQKDRVRETFEMSWLVTNPKGESFNIVNLRKFCSDNGLDQGNMVKVSQGKIKQNKGWKCVKISS
jgi:ATP-dependent 26S proteasome regulatory subunit